MSTKHPNKFDVAKEFFAGMRAALFIEAPCNDKATAHWQAGYEAGYKMRADKGQRLNAYLVAAGHEPMHQVRLAAARKPEGEERC